MSNEPGGPAPVPDPYAVPDPGATQPIAPVAPSGYEAVPPYAGSQAPVAPYGGPDPSARPDPYGAPVPSAPSDPYGAPSQPAAPYGGPPQPAAPSGPQYGAPQYGAPQYGAPQYGAPQYGAPQYGAPQYGAPQYGTPGYDQPPPPYGAQPYGYGQPYAAPPTEGMAIASFVTSTAGLFFLGGLPGPVGLGLGIAALRRIRVSGKAGRGWAIAGIAVGAVGILWMLAIAAYIVFLVVVLGNAAGSSDFWDEVEQGVDEGSDGSSGTDADSILPDYTLRTDLTAGTCLTTYPTSFDMSDTEPVGCEVPHDAEVVGLVPMSSPIGLDSGEDYDPSYEDAWEACDQLTDGLLPGYFADGDVSLYYPHPDDFVPDSSTVYCVYYSAEPGMTGSVTAHTLQLAGAGTAS